MLNGIKNVWDLFVLDWKRIFKNKLTFLLIIALMIIPSLYAWFNIAALWDPYSNTGGIKIGVYSDDQTVDLKGNKINIGDEIVDNLKKNKTIGWQFVSSKQELDKKVKEGKLYAGIYLPKDFSENLISFTKGEIKYPEIEYQVNQKINAIAPKISDKGAGTIQDTISTEFVETASKTLLEVFNEIGFNLDANLPSIKKITSKILVVDENLEEIDGYTKEILQLQAKMPEFKQKLDMANEFVDYIPELNKVTDKVVDLNGKLPEIAQYGQLVYDVQDNIPKIQNAGAQLNKADNDIDRVVKMMNDAINEASQGLEVIASAQKVLPEVTELINTADGMIPQLQTQLQNIANALPSITEGLTQGLEVLDTLSKVSGQLAADIGALNTETHTAQIYTQLDKLNTQLITQLQMIQSLKNTLNQLSTLPNAPDFSNALNQLDNLELHVTHAQQNVQLILDNWDYYSAQPAELQQKLQEISNTLNQIVVSINPEEIQAQVNQTIQNVQHLLSTAQNITGTIINDNTMETLNNLLNNTTNTINEAISFLKEYQKDIPAIKDEIHTANMMLNGNMDLIVNGINQGADFFRNDFPVVQSKMNLATAFIQNDLPGIESDVVATMDKVNEKAPKLESALNAAEGMIKEDWPNIKDGITKAATAIRKGEKDIDLEEAIKLLKGDANAESQFISDPVKLKTKDVYGVPNYGSASTPFYTALCLWVGAVLFSSIASTKFQLDEEEEEIFTKRQQYMARMGTYLLVGFFQALIVTIGNQLLLGTYTKNPVWNVIFALIIDLTFMMMVYVLVSLFNNLGKGFAIIILVLSISAGGGNFPIEMSGPFFRAINPYIPFTYAVNLLRESVGGIYWPSALKSISILVSVTIAFFIFGYIIYPKAERLFKKINDNLKEGRILH